VRVTPIFGWVTARQRGRTELRHRAHNFRKVSIHLPRTRGTVSRVVNRDCVTPPSLPFRVSCMTAIRITPAAATVASVRTRTRIIRLWQRLLGDQLTNPREHIRGLAFSIRQSRHCSRRTAVLSRLAPPTVRQRRATLRQSLELSRQSPDWVRWMLQLLRQIRACFRQVAGAFRLLTQPVRTIRDRD